MINEKELEIANTSYTNKDFGAIYTEILDIAKKISSLWNPQSSNESDPGVVLLKLLAFIGDKLNYNIDKNTLETFMPSATQEDSMRKLCDMMGYYMNYYKSATTPVTFTYRGDALDVEDAADTRYMTFNKFTTCIGNEDSSLQYVLWEDLTLDTKVRTNTAEAKEGFLNTLNIGDSDRIILDNLNNQNRVYFNERQIAQNGILVKNYDEVDQTATFWENVENLNVQQPAKKCFKFGFDSKQQLPYIEFPVDIATLIGNGLSIRYLVTSGYYGNAKVGSLSKLISPSSVDVTGTEDNGQYTDTVSFTDDEGNTDLLIKNNSAAINGDDAEDIDTAYNNFKRTIGTFRTLVTCRDYANYIYNYVLDLWRNPISNVQVGDRRTDLNHAKNIITYGDNGQYSINTSTDYVKLFIYALQAINNPSNESEYKQSFALYTDISFIAEDLESEGSVADVSYDYSTGEISNSEEGIGLVKILYKLDAKITTTYKVNTLEQLDIKANILDNLRKTFYSRNVDYGYEIPYESIYNCILNADSRIKSVSLKEPELSTQYILTNNNVVEHPYGTVTGSVLTDYTDSVYLKMLAKNVLAGKVALFEYDNSFNYEYGMKSYTNSSATTIGPVIRNVESFSSKSEIPLTANPFTVGANEIIQLIGPKLVDEKTFGVYVNYYYIGNTIYANTDYRLKANDKLLLVYTDTSQNQVEVVYKEGDIIRSTFDIVATGTSGTTPKTVSASTLQAMGLSNPVNCVGIQTNDSIAKRSIVSHEFNSTIKVAWLINEDVEKNTISDRFIEHEPQESGDKYVYECILGDNEYFIYSIDGESSYEVFASGTSLRIESNTAISVSNYLGGTCPVPNLDDLYNYGIEAIKGVLQSVAFNKNVGLVVQVNDIFTLVEGDKVKLDSENINVDNEWQVMNDILYYQFSGDTGSNYEPLPTYDFGQSGSLSPYETWRIRSRLDLVAGPDRTQVLTPTQTFVFYKGANSYEITGAINSGDMVGQFRTNMNLDIPGNWKDSEGAVELNVVDPTNLLSDETYPVSLLVFSDPDNKVNNYAGVEEYYVTQLEDLNNADNILHSIDLLLPSGETSLVMCYIKINDEGESGTQVIFSSGNTLYNYATGDPVNSITNSGLYIFKLDGTTNLQISTSGSTTGTLTLSKLKIADGFNSRFNLPEIEKEIGIDTEESGYVPGSKLENALKVILRNIDTGDDFYYTCKLDKSEQIEEEDLSSPYVFFDSNNLFSRFAISYIDLDNSSIEITRSSKL